MAFSADHDPDPIDNVVAGEMAEEARETAEIEQDMLIRSWRPRA
jgi:hypothetical protein